MLKPATLAVCFLAVYSATAMVTPDPATIDVPTHVADSLGGGYGTGNTNGRLAALQSLTDAHSPAVNTDGFALYNAYRVVQKNAENLDPYVRQSSEEEATPGTDKLNMFDPSFRSTTGKAKAKVPEIYCQILSTYMELIIIIIIIFFISLEIETV